MRIPEVSFYDRARAAAHPPLWALPLNVHPFVRGSHGETLKFSDGNLTGVE
jgi:hypothetical protein